MSTILAHCAFCARDVSLPAHRVELTLHPVLDDRNVYRFTCPHCRERNVKAATPDVLTLLLPEPVTVDQVPDEAEEPHHGPAITWDDVLDFTQALATWEDLARRLTA